MWTSSSAYLKGDTLDTYHFAHMTDVQFKEQKAFSKKVTYQEDEGISKFHLSRNMPSASFNFQLLHEVERVETKLGQ